MSHFKAENTNFRMMYGTSLCDTIGRWKEYWLPWLVGMPSETSQAITCMLLGGVLHRHPNLRVCFAHGGGAFPYTIGRILHGYQVRPDLCATRCKQSPDDLIGRGLFFDSLVHDSRALKLLIDVIGDDKVMLGSDYPFPLGEHHPGKLIEEEKLETALKEKLLRQNALKFLNIKE